MDQYKGLTQINETDKLDFMANEKKQNFYELGYHLSPAIPEAELALATDKIKSLIEKLDGEVKFGDVKKRRLAYPLQKHLESYFGFVKFALEPEKMEKLKNELKLDKQVLRFLVLSLKPEQFEQKPGLPPVLAPITAVPSIAPKKRAIAEPKPKEEAAVPPSAEPKKGMEELDVTLEKILGNEPPKK